MYACGLRIGEAATVEIASVDNASLLLRIIGKGDKERRVCRCRSQCSMICVAFG